MTGLSSLSTILTDDHSHMLTEADSAFHELTPVYQAAVYAGTTFLKPAI